MNKGILVRKIRHLAVRFAKQEGALRFVGQVMHRCSTSCISRKQQDCLNHVSDKFRPLP